MQEACNHSNNLKDADFVRLIAAVERCILHVIGDRGSNKMSPSTASISPFVYDMKSSKSFTVTNRIHRDSFLDHQHRKSEPELNELEKHTSKQSLVSSGKKHNSSRPPSERFSDQCQLTDREREKYLLQKRYIGKILDQKKTEKVIEVTEVNFRWQLGLLIGKKIETRNFYFHFFLHLFRNYFKGEGQYGKVYSCVNLESGESMAMKEIAYKSNDINAIKELADEINNVQGIVHENLVKFYGAELHRVIILGYGSILNILCLK